MSMKARPLTISGIDVQPGERLTLALPTPEIYTCAPLHIPMHILHGKREGPTLLICATFYGDEVNGIAIVKRLLQLSSLKSLSGTIIAIPVMNVYGLINRTRFLPDGHDLANSFPGSEKGSFAARMAYLFSEEILAHCTHSISIRTGGPHTYKIPQVYFREGDEASVQLANAFQPRVKQPALDETGFVFPRLAEGNRPALIYEGGEAHRADEWTIRMGVRGIMKVLKHLKMVRDKPTSKSSSISPITMSKSYWIRASASGLYHSEIKVGTRVEGGQRLAVITDPFGTEQKYEVLAPETGIVTAVNTHPLVYEGQGVVQLGVGKEVEEHKMMPEIPPIQPDVVT